MVQEASAAGAGAYLIKPPDPQLTDRAITVSRARFQDLVQLRKQRSKLEEIVTRLEMANQELELFGDALAHDLRNPLLIVTNFTDQLRETLGDSLGEQEAEDLQRIRGAGRHMLHIINDLRDLTDVNRAEISRTEVDLSALGQDIIDDLRALVPDRDVRFEVEPGIKAVGDRTGLTILLTNLLQNAWKYTGPIEDAHIELGVAEDEGDVPTYYVRDNGIGFDNDDNEVIFPSLRAAPYQDGVHRERTRADHRGANRTSPRRTSVGGGYAREGGRLPLHPRISVDRPIDSFCLPEGLRVSAVA